MFARSMFQDEEPEGLAGQHSAHKSTTKRTGRTGENFDLIALSHSKQKVARTTATFRTGNPPNGSIKQAVSTYQQKSSTNPTRVWLNPRSNPADQQRSGRPAEEPSRSARTPGAGRASRLCTPLEHATAPGIGEEETNFLSANLLVLGL